MKKIYKLVAVLMISCMMSVTVFAAEDTTNLEDMNYSNSSSSEENVDNDNGEPKVNDEEFTEKSEEVVEPVIQESSIEEKAEEEKSEEVKTVEDSKIEDAEQNSEESANEASTEEETRRTAEIESYTPKTEKVITEEVVAEEKIQNSDAIYSGIDVDGGFTDWDAVTKYSLNEPEGDSNVESVAWVIENDKVYIYIKDDGSNSATWAGPNHNGKYAITTDLGRTLIFQLTQDGAIVGADGATSIHEGSQWEIAIPVSSLPANNGGLSFGLYLSDPTLSGYGDTGTVGTSTDIVYDGQYGDWYSYPHQEIQYSTAGTGENVPDGEAAIYMDNNIYGHCTTQMQAHLNEKGGEYTSAITVSVNRDSSDKYGWYQSDLHMRFVSVDSAGNINWYPQLNNLDNGTYEYYIFDTSCWGTSANINNLVEADVCYGKASITVTDSRQDMEWYVDSAKLAQRYGIDETDMKTVSSQYGRIGQEWVTTAGTSTGPIGGTVLCILSAFVPFAKKKFVF